MISKSMLTFTVLLLFASVLFNEVDVLSTEIMDWKSNNIVPDIIDIAPKDVLEVSYPSGVKVNLGNELTPTEVKDIPQINWNADSNEFYTLLMCDPDAPNRQNPMFGEVRHWLVVNIPGNNVSGGTNLYEFVGSGPPSGSGLHRYIFIVFKQNGKISTENITPITNRSREGRLSTKARDLIKEFNLENTPVAGNFYQAQYDDYVPILHQQLGGAPPKSN